MPSSHAFRPTLRLLWLLVSLTLLVFPACTGSSGDDDTNPSGDDDSNQTPEATTPPNVEPTLPISQADSDRDGSPDGVDCDDDDPKVRPGAPELCDELDNDCDEEIDEGVGDIWYPDVDRDGYRSDSGAFRTCAVPLGALPATAPIDCNDSATTVHPGAAETCDGLDNDCDLAVDEGLGEVWIIDADDDGAGDPEVSIRACTQPDGFVPEESPVDCDDVDPFVNPDGDEVCDGIDNDCDEEVDEGGSTLWYLDEDGDGYGAGTGQVSCSAPAPGYVPRGGDCVDTASIIHPDAVEDCDGTDNDCNGLIDDVDQVTPPKGASSYYLDADGDGYGVGGVLKLCGQPTGYATRAGDCDDAAATAYPGATEVCNSRDDDCDGQVDDVAQIPSWYVDRDGDGYGTGGVVVTSCTSPGPGHSTVGGDCADSDATVHPGATEVCNGKDDNCDSRVDDGAVDARKVYPDDDSDGFGDSSGVRSTCETLEDYVAVGGDCDDSDPATWPGALELCDLRDNDCDSKIDEDLQPDTDGDGACNGLDPQTWSDSFNDSEMGSWTVVDRSGTGVKNNWYMNGTVFTELSDAGDSFALGPDLGKMRRYTVAVKNLHSTISANASGIVFGYQDARNYWLARWLDPTNYYKEYPYGGHIDIVQCVDGVCEVVAEDDGTRKLYRTTAVVWSVTVDGSSITVTFDGVQVAHYYADEMPLGPDRVGLYSFDNDGGTQFDDFKVTVP